VIRHIGRLNEILQNILHRRGRRRPIPRANSKQCPTDIGHWPNCQMNCNREDQADKYSRDHEQWSTRDARVFQRNARGCGAEDVE
jgi:hypothetical protein